ncbi:peptide ABC transporter substrate-binding protein [Tengunoibacter tsumagoiensis]|uniref:ABC transporter substrate-binding protein n=1 Tax=Tengunoibacter tsumagoiensis TaxID=2014871 RepID=A0A402AAE4_9CHLR|nr:peptide ABC transporter substrate-binding protein [Tengunoibacter tsumagoiensis]GCE16089.1 ABC transporter substrate-binding protein [Tengunoibacter tsumagoiensis]
MRRHSKDIPYASFCILCLLSILCVACGGSKGPHVVNTTKAMDAQQIYRWAFRLPDINSFDPGVATDTISLQAVSLVFTGLVQLNDELKVQPQLAQSYEVLDNGLTYRFHLRPNVKFSDGHPLDANDVAYTIDRALSPEVNSQSGVALTYLGLIKNAPERTNGEVKSIIGSGILVQDPDTVEITLREPAAYFLQALTYPTSFIVERSVIEQWGSKWTDHLNDHDGQGGAGPFKVKEYSHTTGIVFVPDTNYYGAQPQLREIHYVPYKDRDTSYNAYKANQTEITDIPLAQYPVAKVRDDFSQTNNLTLYYVGLNYRVKPLENIHIRQGMAAALNRDLINKAAWHSAYKPSCHIVPEGMYGYNPALTCPAGTSTKGDARRARELFQQGLKEEGMTTSTFPQLTMTYPSQSPETANEATIEIQMWKTVLGITVNSATLSQNSMYTAQSQTWKNNGPLQIWIAGWGADFPDPQDWISLQFGTNQPNNAYNFGFNDSAMVSQQQELQKQMQAADVNMDPLARAAAYNQIEQQLVDQVAWLTIDQRPEMRLLKPYVQGYKFNPVSLIPPDDWGAVYIAQR